MPVCVKWVVLQQAVDKETRDPREESKMMEIESVWLRREGGENDPLAKAVVLVRDIHGEWRELIREQYDGNFSHIASLPSALTGSKQIQIAEVCPACDGRGWVRGE